MYITAVCQFVINYYLLTYSTEKLIEKCDLTLVTDCSTRWDSNFLMLERLLKVRVAVKEVLDDMAIDIFLN
jgi:hypothetical protein